MRFPILFAFLSTTLALFTVCVNAADRPNVVLIMTDDQGYGDFGATGNPIIETPQLDAMAGRSASMRNFYVCPVCTPTRASLMTGRYNYRTRAIDTYIGRAMMEPAEVTIAEVLSAAGYATGIFGKWHLGDCYPLRAIDQGFDEALIHRGGGIAQPSEPRENQRRYTNPILFHNGEQVETKGYCTDVYFDAAFDFIAASQQADRPFFAYIPTNAPHSPYHDVPEDLRQHYMQKDLTKIMANKPGPKRLAEEVDKLARIAAMITNIDRNVGRLFDKLEELQLLENTLVIFLVDNGPNTKRYVGPYRGSKTGVHEGGIRSPLWLHWPQGLQAGAKSDKISAHIDLMPTILEACQVEQPNDVELDGRSLLPLLKGQSPDWPERYIATQWHRGDVPVRYHHFMIRDSQWKLLNNSKPMIEQLETPPEFELYDLVADPGESTNLIDEHPEVFKRMKIAYDQWFDDVSNTRPDNYAPPRIIIGSDHETSTALTRQDWRSRQEGWHAGTTGHWEVDIAAAGPYNLQVLLDEGSTGGEITLHIGDKSTKHQVDADKDYCELENIELPSGPMNLSVMQHRNGKESGAYQVIVTRQ